MMNMRVVCRQMFFLNVFLGSNNSMTVIYIYGIRILWWITRDIAEAM